MSKRSEAEIREMLKNAEESQKVPSDAKEACDKYDKVSVASADVRNKHELITPVSARVTVKGRDGTVPANSHEKEGIDR